MKIESLLTETEIAEEFVEALEARDLPEKFFYWSPLSVKAWLTFAEAAPYSSASDAWMTMVEGAQQWLTPGDDEVAVISLGAGSGAKDYSLVHAVQEAGHPVAYYPVDASQALLEKACAGAEDLDFETVGLKADISSPMHLVLAADVSDHARIFLMNGNTLGGFDPLDQIQHIAKILRPQDRLIIDAEIDLNHAEPSPSPVAKSFVFAPLASIGVTLDHGYVQFERKTDERFDGLSLITRYFHAEQDLVMNAYGREIALQRSERVSLNFQYEYTPEGFRRLLTKKGGLEVIHETLGANGRYLIAVCSRPQ